MVWSGPSGAAKPLTRQSEIGSPGLTEKLLSDISNIWEAERDHQRDLELALLWVRCSGRCAQRRAKRLAPKLFAKDVRSSGPHSIRRLGNAERPRYR